MTNSSFIDRSGFHRGGDLAGWGLFALAGLYCAHAVLSPRWISVPGGVLLGIEIVFLAFSVLASFLYAFMFREHVAVMGVPGWRTVRRMWWLKRFKPGFAREVAEYALLLLFVAQATWLWADGEFPRPLGPAVVIALWTICVTAVLLDGLPPGVLFLGSSTAEGFHTLEDTERSTVLRVVSLLHPAASVEPGIGVARDRSFRTKRAEDWRGVALRCIEEAHLVVMDARTVTGPTLEEAVWLLDPARSTKAVFVVGDAYDHPLLDRVRADRLASAVSPALVTRAGLPALVEARLAPR